MINKRPKSFRFYCFAFLCVFVLLGIVLFSCIASDPTGRLFSVMILFIILPGGLSWAQRSAELAVMSHKVQAVKFVRKDGSSLSKEDILWLLDHALSQPSRISPDEALQDSSRI